jgi:hypothetical protein
LEELTVDLVQAFLESITNGRKPQTRKIRFAHLTSFFNFIDNNLSPDSQNPCNSPMLRKLFRPKITTNWNIIEKDAVDEIIFRSGKESAPKGRGFEKSPHRGASPCPQRGRALELRRLYDP